MNNKPKKIQLEPVKEYWSAPGMPTKSAAMSLPFYKSRAGIYVHRVRHLQQFWADGKFSHATVDFWCGNSGGVGKKGVLMAHVEDGVLCATCEGRAIGAGLCGGREINGQPVMFSPKR